MPAAKVPPSSPRHALRVDPARKAQVQRRLKRIEGQVRGLQRMVDDERYCADILMQVASVQRALSSAGKVCCEITWSTASPKPCAPAIRAALKTSTTR